MPNSKFINQRFMSSTQEPIDGCLAFLIENVHETEVLKVGFEQGNETIELQPTENRPFRASTGYFMSGKLHIKMGENGGSALLIKEIPTHKETL